MRSYDWVFFDAGETLFNLVSPGEGFAAMLADVGYRIPPDALRRMVDEARLEALTPDHLEPGDAYAISIERAQARRERLVQAIMQRLEVRAVDRERCRTAIQEAFVSPAFFGLYSDALQTLDTLRAADYRLGIISNWEPRLDQLCQAHGLAAHFEFILASEAIGYAKPGPRIFQRALELAGVAAGQAVHVGDSYWDDVLGASALGIQAVLLDRGDYYPANQWQPTVRSLRELPELLAGFGSRG